MARGWLLLAALLLLYGLAGESDRRDQIEAQALTAEIYAAAPGWAVRE